VWRVAKVSVAAAIVAALLGAGSVASTDTHPEQFINLLKTHQFREAAAEFYYEPTHTPVQIAKDKADIVNFMEKLFLEIGDIQGESPVPKGSYTSWILGITASDRPYPAADIGADDERVVVYEVQLSRGERDWLQWKYVHIRGQWKVFSFQFEIPMSEAGGKQRIDALAAKLFPPATQHAP
jgi:hypothetical protein